MAAEALRVFDLAQPLGIHTHTRPMVVPFRMGITLRHTDATGPDGTSAATEVMTMSGHNGTHIDALCRVAHDGRLHGGVDADEAQRGRGGFTEHGTEKIWPLVYDAVLLDIPKVLGVERLDAGHEITAYELRRTLEAQDVELRPGTGALIRTGWGETGFYNSPAYLGLEHGMPGPAEEGSLWLRGHGVRIVGSDTLGFELYSGIYGGNGGVRLPGHRILMVEGGVYIMKTLYLEELAAERIYEFLLVAPPLKIVGATCSPLRPLALVA